MTPPTIVRLRLSGLLPFLSQSNETTFAEGLMRMVRRLGLPSYYSDEATSLHGTPEAEALAYKLVSSEAMLSLGKFLKDDGWAYDPRSGWTYNKPEEEERYWGDIPYLRLLSRVLAWIYTRVPYYSKLASSLSEAEESGLLSPVVTTGKSGSRYVDTPDGESKLQNYYDDDSHATNTTAGQTETSTDFDTPMGRVNEIISRYPDLFNRMRNEFEGEFGVYA